MNELEVIKQVFGRLINRPKMKKTLILIFFVFFLQTINGQKSRVFVVGTPHTEQKFINPDTLENLLAKIEPNVILIELDSGFFTKDFKFNLEKYPDLLSTNENISIYNYSKNYPLVKVRPFDITGRNEFYKQNDYFNKEKSLFKEMLKLYKKNKLSDTNKNLFKVAMKILSQYGEAKVKTLSDINSDFFDKFTELKYSVYDIFIQICSTERKLKKWVEFAHLQKNFWEKRNKIMATNISNFAEEFKGKKLVVFVGYEHRYFLINELKNNENIELVSDFLN